MTATLHPPGPDLPGDDQSADAALLPFIGRQHPSTGPARHYQTDGSLALKSGSLVGDALTPQSAQGVARSARIVTRALLEVLSGWRPASQLARWTTYSLQQDLQRRAPRRPTSSPLQLLRVRVCEQSPGIAEICALADDTTRKRIRVVALRMERREGDWVVTRLQFG